MAPHRFRSCLNQICCFFLKKNFCTFLPTSRCSFSELRKRILFSEKPRYSTLSQLFREYRFWGRMITWISDKNQTQRLAYARFSEIPDCSFLFYRVVRRLSRGSTTAVRTQSILENTQGQLQMTWVLYGVDFRSDPSGFVLRFSLKSRIVR